VIILLVILGRAERIYLHLYFRSTTSKTPRKNPSLWKSNEPENTRYYPGDEQRKNGDYTKLGTSQFPRPALYPETRSASTWEVSGDIPHAVRNVISLSSARKVRRNKFLRWRENVLARIAAVGLSKLLSRWRS
jgi:hypothetical protein